MSLVWIIALVVLLYARTLKYNYVIDDNVKRGGYMYEVPLVAPPLDFFDTKPSPWYRAFMIGMHCVNVSIIYMLWGWCPALLFAVHPLCVWGVAWVTGNYYATAAYFTLIAYFFIYTFPNIFGSLAAMVFFTSALNSTVCPINFPFLFLFIGQPWGLTMFFPLIAYLRGKKFTTGIKIRFGINNDKVLRDKLVKENYFRRIAVMVKVVARYTYVSLFPDRLGFFDGYGEGIKEDPKIWNKFHSFDKTFWVSLLLCVVVFAGGLLISPVGIFWFFVLVSIHSQFNLTGQFYAQRYLYLPIIGLCVVVGTLIQPYPVVVAIVATILIIRTHCFIPAWKNMQTLWMSDVDAFPENPRVYNNVAQYLLQRSDAKPELMNLAGYFLFKAEQMAATAWEIQMNLACFFARVNHIGECLNRTKRAIALLEPLGGISKPLDVLKAQKIDLERIIKKQQEQQQNGVGLVDSLSRPATEPESSKKGRDNG